MARLLLRGGRLEETLPAVGARLAQALGLASAAIELRAVDAGERSVVFPLREGTRQIGTLVLPAGAPEAVLRRVQVRIAPALEALLAAALERDALQAEVGRDRRAAPQRRDQDRAAALGLARPALAADRDPHHRRGAALAEPHRRRARRARRRRSPTRRRRLSRLIDDLLDLSRLEADAAEPHPEWCSVEEVVARRDRGPQPAGRTPSRSRSTPTCRRCAPTPPSSSARSRTCSRTPTATPAATRSRCARATSAGASCCASSTAAPASRRPSASGSSSPSTAPARGHRPPRLRPGPGDRARVRRGQRRQGLGRVAARPGDLVRGRASPQRLTQVPPPRRGT